MAATPSPNRHAFWQSISFKNLLLFLLILLVALTPLALRYYQDSREYEISILASKLEFFAERGASWIDVAALSGLTQPRHMQTAAYHDLINTLSRIEHDFGVDNAIVMRRDADGRYTYIASGAGGIEAETAKTGAQLPAAVSNPCNPAVSNPCNPAVSNPCSPTVSNPCTPQAGNVRGFPIGLPVHIHKWFPDTYDATERTWQQAEMMNSQLFGGQVGDTTFDQFLQINTPLKRDDQVVAILMLNKFANPVAAAVRAKTLAVVGLSVGILVIGLLLFSYSSSRMLRPLKNLTMAANEVAQGNLDITLSAARSRDEVGRLSVTFDTMLEGLRQRDVIRDAFGRYISKEVADEILDSPDGLKLGGETREVTFLVSDLRGFTSLSARLPPHDVIDILNRYLERMVDIIDAHRGTVDEFQGDGILAFFGAPLAADDDQERAVACALAMQTALTDINAEQRRRQLPELNMGIGINTGNAILGNIGSEKRTKYGAVGSAINEAYRIESYTIGGQILISPSVYERVRDLVEFAGTKAVQFKGLEQPITLYDIVGIHGSYATALPAKTPETFVTLATALPIACYPVEGKMVSDIAISGRILRLSDLSAEAELDGPIALHSNFKLRLEPSGEPALSDVYTKVVAALESSGSDPTRVRLGFTSVPEPAKVFLQLQRERATFGGIPS